MNLCLITPECPPHRYGGIGIYVNSFAEGFARRGHRVTVIGYRIHDEERISHPWGESISVRWVWPFLWRYDRHFDPFDCLRAAIGLRLYLKRSGTRFDIVETPNWLGHGCFLGSVAGALVTRLSTPHLDTLDRPAGWADRVVNWPEGRSCRRARLVISNTTQMARKAVERYGIRQPTTIIPHGIPEVPFISLPKDDTVDILYIGRAQRRKGVDILLQALADLLPGASSTTATFVGTDLDSYVSEAPHLSAAVDVLRTKTGGRFRELGVVSDESKRVALSAADWLVVPSRFESFGIVAIEAMREGTPLIVTRGTTLEDIGQRAPATLLFDLGDPASLLQALQTAVSLGPRYKTDHAEAIRQGFRDNFSLDKLLAQSERAYVEAVRRA